MARNHVIQYWCDVCYTQEDGEGGYLMVEATEFPAIRIGSGKARIPALCEVHEKEIWNPLQALMEVAVLADESNMLVAPTPKSGSRWDPDTIPVACPLCGDHLKNRGSLSGHVKGPAHRQLLAQVIYDNHDGKLFDIAGNLIWEVPPPTGGTHWKCEVRGCDAEYFYPGNTRPNMAGASHMRVAHPDVHYVGVNETLWNEVAARKATASPTKKAAAKKAAARKR